MDAPLKKSTAEWIAEVLCDYPVFEYGVDAPRREAETTIRNLPTNWDNKRLAIVVAGFDQRGVPLCAEVANFDTTTGIATDQNRFTLNGFTMLTGRRTGSRTAGARLSELQHKVLRRYVPRIIQQHNGINRAIKVMV